MTDIHETVRGREAVLTHCWHIVSERHDSGRLSTKCGYHLHQDDYSGLVDWDECPVTATHICHHCAAELREGDE